MLQDAALLSTVRSFVLDDVLAHMPSIWSLAMMGPMGLQAALLYPPQTDNLRHARMALIPLGLYFSYQVLQYDFIPRDSFRPYNFIKNLAFPIGVSRTLEYGLVKDRYYWIGIDNAHKKVNQEADKSKTRSLWSLATIKFAILQLISHRGQGWSWGVKGDLIPPPRPADHYVSSGIKKVIQSNILLVLAMTTIQYSRNHSTDFLEGLGVPHFPGSQMLSRLALVITFGTAVWNFLEVGYTELSIIAYYATATLRLLPLPKDLQLDAFDARMWPPLLRSPFLSTSLSDFWTYRWHSILRRVFLVMGFKPASYVTSWMGKKPSAAFGVIGAFFVSGVLHEMSLYFGTRELGLDTRLLSMRFFLIQGLGLVAEQGFTTLAGRKVGGWAGRFWLILVLGFPGADVSQAWLDRGLLNDQPTPDTWEWWRWLIPMVSYVPRLSAQA